MLFKGHHYRADLLSYLFFHCYFLKYLIVVCYIFKSTAILQFHRIDLIVTACKTIINFERVNYKPTSNNVVFFLCVCLFFAFFVLFWFFLFIYTYLKKPKHPRICFCFC